MDSQELAGKMDDMALEPSYVKLKAELERTKNKYAKLKTAYRKLEDEYGHMDDYNRELEAEVKTLELENKGLQEEVDQLKQVASSSAEDQMPTSQKAVETSAMAMEAIQPEQEQEIKLGPIWQTGPCRLGGPDKTCKYGYHLSEDIMSSNNKGNGSQFAYAT
jgi:predicted nuclease with TOPRIM domain